MLLTFVVFLVLPRESNRSAFFRKCQLYFQLCPRQAISYGMLRMYCGSHFSQDQKLFSSKGRETSKERGEGRRKCESRLPSNTSDINRKQKIEPTHKEDPNKGIDEVPEGADAAAPVRCLFGSIAFADSGAGRFTERVDSEP